MDLKHSFAAARDLVEGDEYQLQQAFVNLFLNSLEAMSPQGLLTVTTEDVSRSDCSGGLAGPAGRGELQVTVQDTGAGISPEHLARLFEPFFTTKPHGTGLGLPITRGIIQEHGGEITVQSELGRGTRFAIVLPLLGGEA
jgi:signal transduction histidine kinase